MKWYNPFVLSKCLIKKKEVKISALLVIYFYLFVIYLFDIWFAFFFYHKLWSFWRSRFISGFVSRKSKKKKVIERKKSLFFFFIERLIINWFWDFYLK